MANAISRLEQTNFETRVVAEIQLWFLELHDSPLELKGELQYLDENCNFRGEKITILV